MLEGLTIPNARSLIPNPTHWRQKHALDFVLRASTIPIAKDANAEADEWEDMLMGRGYDPMAGASAIVCTGIKK